MSSAYYEDGTEIPPELFRSLSTLNNGDLAVLVWKDGKTRTEVILNSDLRWFAGGIPLTTIQPFPWKITFHDSDILTIVNVSQIASTHGGV